MSEQEPTTQVLKASEARQHFSQILNRVFRGETRVVVEKSGIPVAAIISAADLRRFTQWEAERARRFKALDEIRKAFRDVPDEELEREVERAITTAREELRREMQRAS